jgi:hypothetical protein
VKKLIGVVAALALGTAGFFATRDFFKPPTAPGEKEASAGNPHPEPQGEPLPVPMPETMITLKRAVQWKDVAGNPGLMMEAGTQLATEATQGLDYIVTRDGQSLRIRCDDAYESHGRFTDGRAEKLALQIAAEIRAEGKVPTNERIVSRAQDELEQRRLNASFDDPASVVDTLQRVLLHPAHDLDAEPAAPAPAAPATAPPAAPTPPKPD